MLTLSYTTLIIAGIALLIALVTLGALTRVIYEAKSLYIDLTKLHVSGLDPRLEGLRIVFLADVHAGPPLRHEGMNKLVDRINAMKPDLILLGGDYVGGKRKGNNYFYSGIEGLRSAYGAFAVLGNHDYWETPDIDARMKSAGITLLRNSNGSVEVEGARVWVAGVDDLWEGKPDLQATMEGINPDDFAILISHNPDYFAQGIPANDAGFDLALAGHTHAGQITAWGKYAYAPTEHGRRYLKDWRIEGGVPILVTAGVGTVGFPIRFHARPEIHLIELTCGSQHVENMNLS